MNPNEPAFKGEAETLWLSVADFAAARGVSIRTVKRYIENGQVETRKDGARRLVRPLELGPESDTKGTRPKGHKPGAVSLSSLADAQNEGHKRDTEGTQTTSLLSEREAELKDEIRFLRGIVESDRRDMAELRAALREALKVMPKQLTAGDSSTNERHGFVDENQNARNAQESPKTFVDEQRDTGALNGPQSAPEREKTGLSYGDVADWLERQFESENRQSETRPKMTG